MCHAFRFLHISKTVVERVKVTCDQGWCRFLSTYCSQIAVGFTNMTDDPRNWNNTKEDNIKSEMNKILFFHIHLSETIYLSRLYSSFPSQILPGILYKSASLLSNQDTVFFLSFFVPFSFLLPKTTKRYFNSFSLPFLCSSLHPTCCLSEYPPRSTQPYKDKVIEQITKLLETENDFLKIIWKITFKPKYYIVRGKTPEETNTKNSTNSSLFT